MLHTFSQSALIVIDLEQITGALLLILFISKLFCANQLFEIIKLTAMNKFDFKTLLNNTKVCTKSKSTLDKNQEMKSVIEMKFFLISTF